MREIFLDITIALTRVALGAYFILASVSKLQTGVGSFVKGTFSDMQPGWLPDWFATPFGYALPWIEIVVGALLIAGIFTRITASVMALLLVAFTIVTTIWHPNLPLHPNAVLLPLALLLATLGPGRISIDQLIGWRKPVRG